MNKIIIFIGIITISLLLISCTQNKKQYSQDQLDKFAQCLSDKGVKMYGAYWCPHCLKQKDMFGSSWGLMNYVECSLPNNQGQTKECADAKINGYPTWVFSETSRREGEVTFKELSDRTGCKLE